MRKFEVGNRYSMRSVCDHNCVWSYDVVARTAKTVTLKDIDTGKVIRRVINAVISKESELAFPLGHYSMAPVLRA